MWGSTSIFLFLAIKSMRIIMHLTFPFTNIWGFHCISAGKESACNAGGPGSIPGSGRSAREGTGYPLPYSWASLVAQLVRIHLQCRFDPWVGEIPWRRGDPLEMRRATHSSVLAWRIPSTVYPWGCKEWGTTEHLPLPQYLWSEQTG